MAEEAFTSREIDSQAYECYECNGHFTVGEVPDRNGDGYLKHVKCNDGEVGHTMQVIEYDKDGVIRFRRNHIVRHLLDNGPFDMNDIACGKFSRQDQEQFAQLIGYSVSGFGDLSYASPRVVRNADAIANALYEEKSQGEG